MKQLITYTQSWWKGLDLHLKVMYLERNDSSLPVNEKEVYVIWVNEVVMKWWKDNTTDHLMDWLAENPDYPSYPTDEEIALFYLKEHEVKGEIEKL